MSLSSRLRPLFLLAAAASAAPASAGEIAVGAAKIDVTPTHPTLLTGYGHREGEFDGVDAPLWVRSLALGDENPAVLVAVDNCGVPTPVVAEVRKRLAERGACDPSRVNVCATHTHNAPALPGYAPLIWEGRDTPEQRERLAAYAEFLTAKIVEVAVAALADRKPAEVSWGQGRGTFGGNRRAMRDGVWVGFGFAEDAPVDRALPALYAKRDGRLVAVWANYACHCTSAGSENRVGGDWAGFAAAELEKDAPDAVAVVTIGCGADVGPQPTGNVGLSRRHGRTFADEVARVAKGELKPLAAAPEVVQTHVELPLVTPPGREHWEQEAKRDGFEGRHARRMLAQLDRDGKLPATVPYPVTAWKFGDDLAIVFLPGEVTVDYAVRLKSEMDWTRLWINGWSNDVPGYIPSRRVLDEGGYEPDFSQIYYGWPSRYAPEVEDTLVSAVEALIGDSFRKTAQTPEPDLFRVPKEQIPSMRQ